MLRKWIAKYIKNEKILLVVVFVLSVILGTAQALAANGRPQRSTLSGQVVSTVSVGTQVNEGTVLVTVKTLAGAAPAARANCSGKVTAVQVAPGSQIAADQVVAEIEP